MSQVLSLVDAPYVSNVICVISHSLDARVRYKVEEAERTFGRHLGGVVKSTNVDLKAPAELPRLSLVRGDRVVTIANDRIQITLSYRGRKQPVDEVIGSIERNLYQFYEATVEFRGGGDIGQIGIIVELAHPSRASKEELFQLLADCLYAGPRIGELASLELSIGFKTDGLFLNFGASVYELRVGRVDELPPHIDFSNLSVDEFGLNVKIDVNDRPSSADQKRVALKSYERVLAEIKRQCLGEYRKLFEKSK